MSAVLPWCSVTPLERAALVRASPTHSITLEMSSLDDTSGGQTIVYREDGDKIHLLYSGEFTTLFTIEESLHERSAAWPNAPASAG